MANAPQVSCSLPIKFDGVNATIFDVLFHILILSLILELVYEVKLKAMSHDLMKHELKQSMKDVLGTTFTNSNIEVQLAFFDGMASLYSNDEDYNKINELIVGRNRIFIGFLLAATVGYFLTMAYSCKAKDNRVALFNTLANNSLLLIVVGIIETVFVFGVAMKYVPTPPSLLSNTILERLHNLDTPVETDCEFDMVKPCGSQLPFSYRIGGFLISGALLASFVGRYKPKTHGVNLSTVMWQGTMITVVVSTLFLTIGTTQEMLIARSSINRIVDELVGSLYKNLKATDPHTAALLLSELRSLKFAEDKDADALVERSNAKLRVRALKIVGGSILAAIVVSVVQMTIYKKLRDRGYASFVDEAPLHTLYAAMIAGLCSFISEFNFLVNVAGPSRPISSNEVAMEAISAVRSGMTKVTTKSPSSNDSREASVAFSLPASPSPKYL